MNVSEKQEPRYRYPQFPGKGDGNQNQSQIRKETDHEQNQSGEHAQNPTVVQDPMAGFDAISWMGVEDFTLPDEAFTSLPETGYLFSSSYFSTSPSLHAPICVPGSFPGCSSEMTMQPMESNHNAAAETQFGMEMHGSVDFSNLSVSCGSSDVLLDDVLMVDEPGACTDQLFNLNLLCPGFGETNNISAIEEEEKEEGDDLAKFFLEWLKENKDAISLEDLRSIRLKKSIIECAARQLGTGPSGRLNLVKLILQWVQDHHLRNKRWRLQEEQSNINTWVNPNPNPDPIVRMDFDMGSSASGCNSSDPYGFPQSCTISGGVGNSRYIPAFEGYPVTYETRSQQTQYSATAIFPLSNLSQNMTSIPSATREAQKARMAQQRRMSSLQKRRALGKNGDPMHCQIVGQENNDAGDLAFWSALTAYPEQGMEKMDLSLLFGGSSSDTKTTLTMHGSGQHESSTSQPEASVPLRLRCTHALLI